MSFDEMYDEMLHGEFSSHGKHQAKAAAAAVIVAEPAETLARARHAAAAEPASAVDEGPRGFQRYRTAALVGAGGMACAAAGAFLGGLGGYFTISPAAAHPVAAPTITQDLPLAQAVNQAAHAASSAAPSSAHGNGAVAAASISKLSGGLTQGIAPFQTLTAEPLQNLPVVGLPGLPGTSTGTGGTGGGTTGGGTDGTGGTGGGGTGGTGCATSSSDLGLTCILQSLTSALSNLGSVSGGNPGTLLDGLVPSLTGVVSDVTGTLQNLTSLLPIASLPTTGGGGTTVLAGATNPVTGAAGTTGTGSSATSPLVSALAPVLNGVTGLTGGGLGSPIPSIPSLPLTGLTGAGSSVPSLPITTPSGSSTPPPTVSTPSDPTTGGSNTINVPLPLPITVPTISIGGLSVGINSNQGSGLTLSLP